MANCIIQCPLNHLGVNVRRYLASSAPAGSRSKKPKVITTACAMISFWYGSKGIFTTEPPDMEPAGPEPEVDDAGEPGLEPEDMAFVRSRVAVPESRCCINVASTADDPGFVVPNAHIMFCFVSEFAYRNFQSSNHNNLSGGRTHGYGVAKLRLTATDLKTTLISMCIKVGRRREPTELRACDKVASRGGEATTVGMT